ncbi:hypothetical protein, partial [Shimia thalassica]|uniref:hypothetical protein n=1 Tax=Shimia thalassica TaxID=1715693 RepID=UPI0027338FB8
KMSIIEDGHYQSPSNGVRAGRPDGYTHTASDSGERSGNDDIEEAFIIYRPTGQIMWALVDGAGQESIHLQVGGSVFDLMA